MTQRSRLGAPPPPVILFSQPPTVYRFAAFCHPTRPFISVFFEEIQRTFCLRRFYRIPHSSRHNSLCTSNIPPALPFPSHAILRPYLFSFLGTAASPRLFAGTPPLPRHCIRASPNSHPCPPLYNFLLPMNPPGLLFLSRFFATITPFPRIGLLEFFLTFFKFPSSFLENTCTTSFRNSFFSFDPKVAPLTLIEHLRNPFAPVYYQSCILLIGVSPLSSPYTLLVRLHFPLTIPPLLSSLARVSDSFPFS